MEESRLQKIETGNLMHDSQRKSCAKRENRRSEMSYFPMFIDIEGKHILVVGAGKIALRRVQTLCSSCAHQGDCKRDPERTKGGISSACI